MPVRKGYVNTGLELEVELYEEFKRIAKEKHLVMRGVLKDLVVKWIEEKNNGSNQHSKNGKAAE